MRWLYEWMVRCRLQTRSLAGWRRSTAEHNRQPWDWTNGLDTGYTCKSREIIPMQLPNASDKTQSSHRSHDPSLHDPKPYNALLTLSHPSKTYERNA